MKSEYREDILALDLNKIAETGQLFTNLYNGTNGFVKIMSGNNRKGYFYNTEVLKDTKKLDAILRSRRFSIYNLYASLSTYKTMQCATMDNILAVNALAIDVDFTLYQNQEIVTLSEAMNALELAILEGFPEPTYIEYSRNMRLVYILEQSYVIPSDKKKAESSRMFLKRTIKCLCDKLNAYSSRIYFNAGPQRLTSFIRIPFSYNRRISGHYDYNEMKFIVDKEKLYSVNFDWRGIFWDIDKLSDMVLPPLFDGYDEWKATNKKRIRVQKNSSRNNITEASDICLRRLREFEELQKRGYDKGYREKMCYFYWLTAIQSGQTEEEAVQSVKKFNANFKIPLEEHRLLTDCKSSKYIDGRTGKQCEGWERHFKDSTIREQLGLGIKDIDLFRGEGMSNSERCKKYKAKKREERELAGLTKQKQIEQNLKQVKDLREKGMTWEQVANEMNLSLRTAKRYGQRIKEM